MLRGCRIGFHWHPKTESMIRLSVEGDHFRVWICPPALLPSGKLSPVGHLCWWDDPKLIDLCPAIAAHARPDRLVCFCVDDDGKEI
jgi:hypothetical protein